MPTATGMSAVPAPGNAFSDQQKQDLATSVGYAGQYDPGMFNKELDPSTGQQKLYIKMGGNKIFGPQNAPVTADGGLPAQVDYMKQQFQPKTLDDIYGAILKSRPTPTEITAKIGQQTGLSDRIAGVRAQMSDIQRSMTGDQSPIFMATNPDGTPVDPRVKVAAFQNNLKAYTDRLTQLGEMETTYKSELETLSKGEADRINQENERNKTALQYLKDVNAEKHANDQFKLQQDQFDFTRSQGTKPHWVSDGN